MDRTETMRFLRVVVAAYPNYRPGTNKEAMKDALDLWSAMLSDVPFPIAAEALKKYIDDKHEFAPSIGHIKKILSDMTGQGEMSEAEAWNMVLVALRNGIYGAEEEYAKLPDDIKEAIGGAHYLREIASKEDVNYSVESSNFYRNLKTVRERRRNQADISPQVQMLIDQIYGNTSAIENKQQAARLEMKNHYEDAYARTVAKFVNGEDKAEDAEERSERGTGFAQMLREKLNMPEFELGAEDEQEKPDGYKIYDEDDLNLDDVPFDDEGIFA